MFTKLTVPPTCRAVGDPSRRRALTPTPNRYERKPLVYNHPDRTAIAFLIDTAAIRNAPNSFRTNETFISNRHKTGPFYVPYDGAGRQSARLPGAARHHRNLALLPGTHQTTEIAVTPVITMTSIFLPGTK
jgi:hypothetical protein